MFPDLVATPFWMALEELDLIYAWSSLLPDDYWRMFHELNWVSITPAARPQSAKEDKSDPLIKEKGFRPIHQLVNQKIKTSLNELTEPILIRYLSAYFDQGFAYRSPTIKSEGLLASFVHFIEESLIPVKPFKKKHLQKWKLKSAEELAQELLYDILPYPDYHHQYIREILISLKGWSGMIKTAEANPHLLPIPRKANLLDFVTIRLMIEWSWLKNYLGFPQITKEELKTAVGALQRDIPSRQKQHLLIDLEKNIQRRYLPSLKNCLNDYAPTTAQAEWSFVFCIDDRECILRRHLENQDPRIQTFGTPGFFGFEFFLRRHDHEHLIKQCPDPVKTDKIIKLKQDLQQNTYPWTTPKWSNLSALKSLFFIKTPKYKNTHLRLIRFEKAPPFDARTAFSLEEAALRIAQIFKSMGWSRITTSLNFIIGHHATTQNNPFFNAYGCGACSGSSGAINACVFAYFANDPEVRELLIREHSIAISQEAMFIPGAHDTTLDTVTFYSEFLEHKLPLEVLSYLSRALEQVQQERQLDYFPPTQQYSDPEKLYKFFWKQGHAIFQVRPEYGHNSVAFCYIGDREKVKSFSFERKSFLQSYDCSSDPDGIQLEGILKAAIPVCAGISLDYFFSRQNLLLGAGTKLSLNINGLFSITNGVEEDILPGLCYQMVERHIPSRINFIIEQNPELILEVLKRNESLWNYVKNEWIILWCYWERDIKKWTNDGWVTLEDSL